jgi:hypothetical protein
MIMPKIPLSPQAITPASTKPPTTASHEYVECRDASASKFCYYYEDPQKQTPLLSNFYAHFFYWNAE